MSCLRQLSGKEASTGKVRRVKMRATATVAAVLLIAFVFLGWRGPQKEAGGTRSGATQGDTARNPTLFEVRQQCKELAAFFPVDPARARQWVPLAYQLAVDAQGKAGGALILMNCPNHFYITTPNSPPLQKGANTAPGSIVHFWFMLMGPAEVFPVPGAQVTGPTQYAYAVADLITSPIAARVYQRAGKNAVLIRSATLIDTGTRQTGKIIFSNGSRITFDAHTPTQLPTPLRVGGNVWNWHVTEPAEMDVDHSADLDPANHVNTTRVMFLASAPAVPNTTQVTIHAESGTLFKDYYGMSDVVASRATFFRPNNIVNNSSRGKLAWTTYPPSPIPVPPSFP